MKVNWYVKKLVVCLMPMESKEYHIYNWFQNYLHKHTQYVKIEDIRSSEEKIVGGVPQDSTLGPLLFLLYINVLNSSFRFSYRIFADDTNMFFLSSCSNEKESGVSNELALVLRYCATQHCLN